MAPMEKLEAQLRSAVESRRYREVEQLIVAYCEAARTYVRSLLPEDPKFRETQTAIQQVLEWTSQMLLAGRASIALELNRLPRVSRYLQTPPVSGSSWHVEG